MTNEEILSHIDHTLLRMTSSWEEIETLCTEAVRFKTASVCVPPSYVKPIHRAFGDGRDLFGRGFVYSVLQPYDGGGFTGGAEKDSG